MRMHVHARRTAPQTSPLGARGAGEGAFPALMRGDESGSSDSSMLLPSSGMYCRLRTHTVIYE